jgi:hypothetical protein
MTTSSSRGQDRKVDRQDQPGVERGCLRGDGAVPWTTSSSQNLQRDSPFEGRCEESVKRQKWKETLTFVWTAFGRRLQRTTSTSRNLQRNTLFEGCCEVSIKRKKWKPLTFSAVWTAFGRRLQRNDFNESKPPAPHPVWGPLRGECKEKKMEDFNF